MNHTVCTDKYCLQIWLYPVDTHMSTPNEVHQYLFVLFFPLYLPTRRTSFTLPLSPLQMSSQLGLLIKGEPSFGVFVASISATSPTRGDID